jgi:hypothetical protein
MEFRDVNFYEAKEEHGSYLRELRNERNEICTSKIPKIFVNFVTLTNCVAKRRIRRLLRFREYPQYIVRYVSREM